MDWQRLDLNLLKVLALLLEERSVARAAGRLCVSPSAVSHALARLRRALGDPLFVREGSSMVPTARARSLERPLATLLDAVDAQLGRPSPDAGAYDPAATRRILRLASPGALDLTLIPAIVTILRDQAPAWSLVVEAFERRSYEADLAGGRTDFVLSVGGQTAATETIATRVLWRDELVLVAGPKARAHAGPATLTTDDYLAQPQVYPLPWPLSQNYLDVELARGGRRRSLPLQLTSYAAVGPVLERSDLVASMPDRTAAALVRAHPGLRILRIAPARRSDLTLAWSRAGEGEPALAWARTLIETAAAAIAAGVDPVKPDGADENGASAGNRP